MSFPQLVLPPSRPAGSGASSSTPSNAPAQRKSASPPALPNLGLDEISQNAVREVLAAQEKAGHESPTAAASTPAASGSNTDAAGGITPILQNLVATTDLGVRLDLKTIALHARNAEYNPKRFAAVIMRIREPKTTALIFASGKMVVTGAKCVDDSRLASRKFARIIQKLGFAAEFKAFTVQNIVGSADVKFPIRLESLAYAHGMFSSYEPELFPGLIYRMVKPKVVLLIFVSGKVVLTGAKTVDDIQTAFNSIYPVLHSYRKPS